MANYVALEQTLMSLVNKRLSAAAADKITGIVGRIIREYEDQAVHSKQEIDRQRRLLDMLLKPHVKLHRADFHLPLLKKEVSPGQQERSSSLVQEDPEPPQIKEEQEELLQRAEDADGSTLTLLAVKSEDDAENREAETLPAPLDVTPTEHPETQAYVEDCGVSPPHGGEFSPSSHVSQSDAKDSDEWEENRGDKSDLNTLNKTHVEGQHLYVSHKLPQGSNASGQKTSVRRHKEQDQCICCKVCGKGVGGFSKLVTSMMLARKITVTCKICAKSFDSNERLESQMRIHKGGKQFKCTVCGNGFALLSCLKKHMATHTDTGEKSFVCPECGKGFGKMDYLKKHMRIHTGVKSYSCAVCDKRFRNNTHLKTHMRSHTGEKPFSCTGCGKGFSQTSSLKTHMRIHTERKMSLEH